MTQATTINGTDYALKTSPKETDEPEYTSQLWKWKWNWNWWTKVDGSYKVSERLIRDTWPATLGESLLAQQNGTKIHAL